MVNVVTGRRIVKIPGHNHLQAWTTPTWCGSRFAFSVMVGRSIETVLILHSRIEWYSVIVDQIIGQG